MWDWRQWTWSEEDDVHMHAPDINMSVQTVLIPTLCYITIVPYSKSGIVPRSSLLGAGQLGFWEFGKGGTVG